MIRTFVVMPEQVMKLDSHISDVPTPTTPTDEVPTEAALRLHRCQQGALRVNGRRLGGPVLPARPAR